MSNQPEDDKTVDQILYGERLKNAVDEYVKQDVSGFANRYYDLGKFLFTVSTFAIISVFTIRTTFGSHFDLVLFSSLVFFVCLYPSYKLTVGIDYEIDPENTILNEYQLKKEWMKKHLHFWAWSFGLGVAILIFTFIYSINQDVVKDSTVEQELHQINETLKAIEHSLNKMPVEENKCVESERPVDNSWQLQQISESLENHRSELKLLMSEAALHDDRHLKLISNKIIESCHSKKPHP